MQSYYPFAWQPGLYPQPSMMPMFRPTAVSQAEMALNQQFRTLWEQHVAWTRMLIISIAEGLKDEEYVTRRLLRNAPEMAALLAPYYGDKVASKLNRLLTDHLILAAQLVKAAKAGDNKAVEETEKKWYVNANDIATFLHQINPYWSEAEFRQMLHDHLRLTKEEAVLRLGGQYAADIEKFDQIEKQALLMADAFTSGIVSQFPDRFMC